MSNPDMTNGSVRDDRSFDDRPFEDRPYVDDPAPVAMPQAAEPQPISLDSMRTSVLTNMATNFEQDDLDVPAFLRKRNDVM